MRGVGRYEPDLTSRKLMLWENAECGTCVRRSWRHASDRRIVLTVGA